MPREESNTQRELRLLRQLEQYIDQTDLEVGHPVRGIFIELHRLRQKKAMNKAKGDAERMSAIAIKAQGNGICDDPSVPFERW
jgi:hypothetical protein